MIGILGAFDLIEGGTNHAWVLMAKQVIPFGWLYLLVRAVTELDLDLDHGAFTHAEIGQHRLLHLM